MILHNLLPRVWRLAFGEWEIPRSLRDSSDDFAKTVRSKVLRAKLWLSKEGISWWSLVLLITAGPAEHLMQEIQYADEKGIFLTNLFSPTTNVFLKAARAYASLIVDDHAPTATILPALFKDQGLELLAEVMALAVSWTLAFAARIWFYLIEFYAGWPYKAGRIVAENVPLAEQQQTSEELCGAKECCLDEGVSMKVLWVNNITRNGFVYKTCVCHQCIHTFSERHVSNALFCFGYLKHVECVFRQESW